MVRPAAPAISSSCTVRADIQCNCRSRESAVDQHRQTRQAARHPPHLLGEVRSSVIRVMFGIPRAPRAKPTEPPKHTDLESEILGNTDRKSRHRPSPGECTFDPVRIKTQGHRGALWKVMAKSLSEGAIPVSRVIPGRTPARTRNLEISGFDAEPVIEAGQRPDPLASPRNDGLRKL